MNDIPKPQIRMNAQENTNNFLCLDGAVHRSLYLKEFAHTCYFLETQWKGQKEHLALRDVSSNYHGDSFKGPGSMGTGFHKDHPRISYTSAGG